MLLRHVRISHLQFGFCLFSLSEFFTRRDRDTISDHKARLDAIASLKKMIESWLEDTYKGVLTEEEIATRAERMDMSLIEQKKEENMKTIFEINSVVRMSLIEMQFIKKVCAGMMDLGYGNSLPVSHAYR